MMDEDYFEPDYEHEDEEEGDVGYTDKAAFYPIMTEIALRSQGINFTLLMEKEVPTPYKHTQYQDYSIHPRFNQPCYGELRKYKSTHPEECTQPGNKKPTDLWHPFPEGKPVAVATNFFSGYDGKPEANDMIRDAFGPEGPWLLGAGQPEFVVKDGNVVGVLLRDTDIDPTRMVNAFNVVKQSIMYASGYLTYSKFRAEGLSIREAFCLLIMTNPSMAYFETPGIPDKYYTTSRLSVRRVLEGMPRDLSGGLFSTRVDYNRTELENVFMSDVKPSFNVKEELLKEGHLVPNGMYGNPKWRDGMTDKEKIVAGMSILSRMRDSEPAPKESKYDIATGKCVLIEPPEQEMKEAA